MKEKLKSRKFIMSLTAVICGILGMFNLPDTTVNSVGNILMVVLPAVAYIITEGRIAAAHSRRQRGDRHRGRRGG